MSWLLDPIANILGYILVYTDKFVYFVFNTHNTGICIILFTFVVNMLMFPLTLKQQKTMKISSFMNPEIQAIQAKYKGKKDSVSMQKMQQEQQAVYDKYGTNPVGGCLPMLIQIPIFFALFQVINDLSKYVPSLNGTNFLGIDLSHNPYVPWNGWDRSFLIPVLAVVTQYISTKLMSNNNKGKDGKPAVEMPGASSMKMMNNFFPFLSGFFCLSMSSGVGLYWISGNIIRAIQSVFINIHFKKINLEKMIEQNKDRAVEKAKKRQVMNQKVEQYSKVKASNIKADGKGNEKPRDYVIDKEVEKGSISGYANMLSGSGKSENKK